MSEPGSLQLREEVHWPLANTRGNRKIWRGNCWLAGGPFLCNRSFSAKWVFSFPAHFLRHFSTKGFYVISLLKSSMPWWGTLVSSSLMSSWTNKGDWLRWLRSHGGQVWTEKRAISSCSQSGSLGEDSNSCGRTWSTPPSSTTVYWAFCDCQGTCTEGSCVMKSEGGTIFLKNILFLICTWLVERKKTVLL